MVITPEPEKTRWLERYSILMFLLLAVGITTACSICDDLLQRPVLDPKATNESGWGALLSNTPYLLMNWGPLFAALVVIGLLQGRVGIQQWLSRFLKWRIGWRQWLLLSTLPLCYMVPFAVQSLIGGESQTDFASEQVTALSLTSAALSGVGEEPGWRGFLQPRVTRRFGELTSVFVIAALWWTWHWATSIPMMVNSPMPLQYWIEGWLWHAASILPFTMILFRLYQQTKGSLFAVAVGHSAVNLVIDFRDHHSPVNGPIQGFGPIVLFWVVGIVMYVSGRKKKA